MRGGDRQSPALLRASRCQSQVPAWAAVLIQSGPFVAQSCGGTHLSPAFHLASPTATQHPCLGQRLLGEDSGGCGRGCPGAAAPGGLVGEEGGDLGSARCSSNWS